MITDSTATELAGIPACSNLTAEEAQFVYHCEVLDLPVRKAALMAGMPLSMISKPHLTQARQMLRRQIRGNLQVTKEDVTFGIKDAINRAKILAEPMTEIAGWDRLIKLHGLDAPQKIDVHVTASMDVLKTHVRAMPDAELAQLVGADSVIDADFYAVHDRGES